MPAFVATDEAAVTAAKRAADTASDNRRAECGNGDPKQRGPNCRQREVDEKDAADKLAAATSAKVSTERAGKLEASMTTIRQRLASAGPVVTVNVQGSALARLFRLPDTEADFAATVQQFGMAAIVELLIAFALIAWEMLRPVLSRLPSPSKEVEEQPVRTHRTAALIQSATQAQTRVEPRAGRQRERLCPCPARSGQGMRDRVRGGLRRLHGLVRHERLLTRSRQSCSPKR